MPYQIDLEGNLAAAKTNGPKTIQRNFIVKNANPYSDPNEEDSTKTVSVKIIDVLFDNQVCSLVYISDSTQILKVKEKVET